MKKKKRDEKEKDCTPIVLGWLMGTLLYIYLYFVITGELPSLFFP